ncbi:SAM-dependent methyltransferase [Photobacterium atrarenae]|uniref:SAM-dependent methyltransferase n=1 Tax=Photobacterium atrarenae TaxID=865757 RepID=A0ABY5GPB2_9GAMM|nr:SAM-dependent methyltransferase [Photobacterium atrarenae]UTV30581.1 SAM-dependent methyltransferase [Photobacterium atrarenae]
MKHGKITVEPVGQVVSTRAKAIDDHWDEETSAIIISDTFKSEVLSGLADFSHIEVLYYFNQVDESRITVGARHPRNNPDWPKVGIFAQRGKNRPNRLGVTICRVLAVKGNEIQVHGLDAIDGTPVIDIKPVMKEFLPREPVKQPVWSEEIMSNYWAPTSKPDHE